MKSRLSLFGVGLSGMYQIGLIVGPTASPYFGSIYCTYGLVLLNCETGEFLDADDMPVDYKPGWLKQGKKDKYGDSDVFHGKAEGYLIPSIVHSTFGESMPSYPNTKETSYHVVNTPDTTKNRVYAAFGTSFGTVSAYRVHHEVDDFIAPDGLTHGIKTKEYSSNGWEITWTFSKDANNWFQWTSKVTGNIKHMTRSSSDKGAHYRQGTCVGKLCINGSIVSFGTSNANSGLTFVPLSAPTNLSSISSELVFSSAGDSPLGLVQRDLWELSELSPGNTEWLSCYNAVEALKYFNFQWAAYLRDMFRIKELAVPLKKFAELASPAMWGELFLWFSYGIAPTYSDTSEIFHLIKKLWGRSFSELVKSFATLHVKYGTSYDKTQDWREQPLTIKSNARLRLRTAIQPESWLSSLFLCLMSLDIGIDATNIWELIPYSFVVDWFANTSELMKWIDTMSFPNQYDLEQRIQSHKRTVSVPAEVYFPWGKGSFIHLTVYKRLLHYTFPVEPFEVRFTDPTSHWLEASALLVTRK